MRLGFLVHPGAGVADSEHHVVARSKRSVESGIFFVKGDVGAFDGELAAAGHGIACIYGEVHNDLLDLSAIGAHGPQFRPRYHDEVDVFANHAGEHLQVLSGNVVEVDDSGGEHLLAAEGKKLSRKRRGALGSTRDLLRRSAEMRLCAETLEQKFR